MDNTIEWRFRKKGIPGQIIVSNGKGLGFIDNRGRAIWYCIGPNRQNYCIFEEGQGRSTNIEISKEDLKRIIEYLP